MSERKINVADFMARSKANGHGERAVLWVQGCNLRCPGCFNTQNWSFEPNRLVPVTEMANEILMIEGIEGISLSGGEPFLQAAALADLTEILQINGLTILIFTGFTLNELKEKKDPEIERLLKNTDMLVSGRFEEDKQVTGKALIASSNQKIISLTGKIPAPVDGEIPQVECEITPYGIQITGFPDREFVDLVKERMG